MPVPIGGQARGEHDEECGKKGDYPAAIASLRQDLTRIHLGHHEPRRPGNMAQGCQHLDSAVVLSLEYPLLAQDRLNCRKVVTG